MLIPKHTEDVDEMTEYQARKLLEYLVTKLDDLDGEDFFGSEGWRHYLGLED